LSAIVAGLARRLIIAGGTRVEVEMARLVDLAAASERQYGYESSAQHAAMLLRLSGTRVVCMSKPNAAPNGCWNRHE
jgi:hypothetical protein